MMTGHIIYRPTIYLEDTGHDYDIIINPKIREYIETEGESYPEPDYTLYTLDITDETLGKLTTLAESDDEKKMINEISEKGISYINIEPHVYFIA